MLLNPTPDISLGLLQEFHSDLLYALIRQNNAYLREWLPWLDTQRGPRDSLEFIRAVRDQYGRNEGLTLGIWFQKALCGVISFHRFDWVNRSSMIGYWLSESHQGKGIMTGACRAMVEYGFRQLKLHRIEIRCATGNTKSCAIPKRLGFKEEGFARQAEWLYDHFVDLVVYAMLSPEWEAASRQ